MGIVNGTTNYMLTRMVDDGLSYEDALAEAQAKGFAEADPTADVDGFDAAAKIAILAVSYTHLMLVGGTFRGLAGSLPFPASDEAWGREVLLCPIRSERVRGRRVGCLLYTSRCV